MENEDEDETIPTKTGPKTLSELTAEEFNALPKRERRRLLVKAERMLGRASAYATKVVGFQRQVAAILGSRLPSAAPTIPKKNSYTGENGLPIFASTSTNDDGTRKVHFGTYSWLSDSLGLAMRHNVAQAQVWKAQHEHVLATLRTEHMLFDLGDEAPKEDEEE